MPEDRCRDAINAALPLAEGGRTVSHEARAQAATALALVHVGDQLARIADALKAIADTHR